MENSYTRYLELKEQQEELSELNTKLASAIADAKSLVSKLDTKFEYIKSYVSELETKGNTELIKVYGVQTDINDLSSRIAQLTIPKE